MIGLLSVFCSSCFFGFSNAFWKKVLADRPFLPIIFVRGLYSSSFFLIACLFDYFYGIFQSWLGVPPILTLSHVGLSTFLCLFSGLGLYFFVKSIKKYPASLIIPLSSINVFGLLAAVFILGEAWKSSYSWAFLAVLIGIILIYGQEVRFNSSRLFFHALAGGLLASFFWGVSYTFFKYPIAWLGVLRFTFLLEFTVTTIVGIFIWIQGIRLESLPHRPIQILAICLILGSIFLHVAYQYASITVIVFAGKFQLIISLLVGRFLYRERLGPFHWMGVSLLLLSIYLISF